ncbi:MAG: 1,4-dihydroxy-2-naphthoate polyprenyltransferase [Vallitaleaceae bacterium]|nr:1,4-dihydroxy-2-naphthoate polyprenyltransferase [Vallitaleaceae bacterium]
MKINSFMKLVEIRTKVASVIPFLIAILYCVYWYNRFRILVIGLFFIAMICIDMATTALNNYMDYKRAILKEGYNYEEHNPISQADMSERQVLIIIIALIMVGTMAGLYLVYLTDIIVLLLGLFAFGIGVLYSFGPIPISRTPFGELFSGILMGMGIFFVCIYTQIFDTGIILMQVSNAHLTMVLNMGQLAEILLVSVPMALGISNIMLANNICDAEEDVINQRYTLPHYIGSKPSVKLFHVMTYTPFITIIIAVTLGILPITSLLTLFVIIPLIKGSKEFHLRQIKSATFVIAVKQFVILNSVYGLTIAFGLLIKWVVA